MTSVVPSGSVAAEKVDELKSVQSANGIDAMRQAAIARMSASAARCLIVAQDIGDQVQSEEVIELPSM